MAFCGLEFLVRTDRRLLCQILSVLHARPPGSDSKLSD